MKWILPSLNNLIWQQSVCCKGWSMSMPMPHINVVLLLQAVFVGHENCSQSFLESLQWHHGIILYHLLCSNALSTSHRTTLEGSGCLLSVWKARLPDSLSGCISHFRSPHCIGELYPMNAKFVTRGCALLNIRAHITNFLCIFIYLYI